MPKRPVDNSALERWRGMDAVAALRALADHVTRDPAFTPRDSIATTRWHVSAGGHDFELLCTGSKFFDTRAKKGGGGAVDLAMHLLSLNFKAAANLLATKGL